MARTSCSIRKKQYFISKIVTSIVFLYIALSGGRHTQAAILSWNTGANVGEWGAAVNWFPNQVPGVGDEVWIGTTPIAENANVLLNADVAISSLVISDGMYVQTLGFGMLVAGQTSVSGRNEEFFGNFPSRLRVEQGLTAVDFGTFNLNVSDEAEVEIVNGAWVNVDGRFMVDESSIVRGDGVIYLERDGLDLSAFSLNGRLQVSSGVMEIFQAGTSLIDLDGSGGTGRISLLSELGAPDVLTITGTELHDSFDGRIVIASDNRINMNLTNGWTLGENGQIILLGEGFGLGNDRAVIEGSELAYRGELQVYNGIIESDVTFYDTASVIFADSELRLEGNTTFAGATFNQSLGSDPLLRQIGDLTVTQDTTLNIPSGRFDWDGEDGNTVTTIEPNTTFTINADAIDTFLVVEGRYDGQTNIGDGGQLVVNTPAAWGNNGVIRLEQATLEGSGIVNTGLIQGTGKVSPTGIDNRGTLRSFGGGLLSIGPNQGETGGLISALPVDGIDALELGVINYGFDLDGSTENGVLLAIDGDLRVDGFQGMFVFDGTLNIGFGNEYLMNTGGLHNRGTITITGGGQYRADLIQDGQLVVSLGVLGDATIVSDDARFGSSGTNSLFADLYLQGNVAIESGATFEGDSSLVNMVDSILTLEDGAAIGVPIENLGWLELDDFVASAKVTGFVNDPLGTLAIDLASGGMSGSDYDQLIVGGIAELGGTLDVELLGGFMPSPGDDFTVLSASGGIVGIFDAYNLPSLTDDNTWFVRYEPNEVILLVVAVPEPSTLLLGVLGALGLLPRRRTSSRGGCRVSA